MNGLVLYLPKGPDELGLADGALAIRRYEAVAAVVVVDMLMLLHTRAVRVNYGQKEHLCLPAVVSLHTKTTYNGFLVAY